MAYGGRKSVDDTLIALLATGHTVAYAADQAGVSERTVFRRLQDVNFRQRVQALRAQAVERAVALLSAASAGAVGTLIKLLDAESEAVRLGAARTILEVGGKLREGVELEERIARLESALGRTREIA